ncbi:hypothetical protein DDI_3658 [Dickeya dianthicola RNS04.9]|nr:hypothetical protein DDI_3658 [Dickeya dianthicola RNS04.9]
MTRFGLLHAIHTQRTDSIGKFFTRGHALLQIGLNSCLSNIKHINQCVSSKRQRKDIHKCT